MDIVILILALTVVIGWFFYKQRMENFFYKQRTENSPLDISVPSIEDNDPGLAAFKEHLEEKLVEAKASLIMLDEMLPLFIYSTDEGVKEISLTMKDEDREKERAQMQRVCTSPQVKFAALLFDTYVYTGPEEKIKEIQKRGTDLQDVGGAVDVILLFLYSRKGKTCNRMINYEKQDVEKYWFSDRGYQDVSEPGEYISPFPA